MALAQESSAAIFVVKNTKWRFVQNLEIEDVEFVRKRVIPLPTVRRKTPSPTPCRETAGVGPVRGGVDSSWAKRVGCFLKATKESSKGKA